MSEASGGIIARTDCAKKCAEQWPYIKGLLARGCDETQFYASSIIEMNTMIDVKPASAVIAMKNLAMVGLVPGSALKLAWYVPFKGVVSVVIGYRGYVELAYAGGFLKDLHTDVVLSGEEISYWKDETGPKFRHVVGLNRVEDMSNVIGAYCIYHTRNGGRGVKLVQGDVVQALYKKAGANTPWRQGHHVAMSCKTAVRRVASEWPQVPQLALALKLDELLEDLDQEQGDLSGNGTMKPQNKIDLESLPPTKE